MKKTEKCLHCILHSCGVHAGNNTQNAQEPKAELENSDNWMELNHWIKLVEALFGGVGGGVVVPRDSIHSVTHD